MIYFQLKLHPYKTDAAIWYNCALAKQVEFVNKLFIHHKRKRAEIFVMYSQMVLAQTAPKSIGLYTKSTNTWTRLPLELIVPSSNIPVTNFAQAIDKPPPSVAGAAKMPYFVSVGRVRGLLQLVAHRIE